MKPIVDNGKFVCFNKLNIISIFSLVNSKSDISGNFVIIKRNFCVKQK